MNQHRHATGVRIGFAQAPEPVRQWVAQRLGGEVTSVVDCVGGMSPGPAARVRSVAGTRAFVKGCGPELNPVTPRLVRDEARILAMLPEHPGLPRLLDVYDDGDWVALLIEDLPGEVPPVPWSPGDLHRASELLASVRPVLDDVAADEVPLARDSAPIFTYHWKRLADRLDRVDPWWAQHHGELLPYAERVADLIDGTALLHWDVRADNMIFGEERDVLVDWGQSRRGAAWMDQALLALDCSMSGSEVSTAQFFAQQPALARLDRAVVVSLVAALAMALAARSVEDAPPGLPTLPATRARWAENLRRELVTLL